MRDPIVSDSFCRWKGALLFACACPHHNLIHLLVLGLHEIPLPVSFTCGGIGLRNFVLLYNPVGPSKGIKNDSSAFYIFSLGIMNLPAWAYLSMSWRRLYFVTSVPTLLCCALVVPTIWNSPLRYVVQDTP
uniref:Uncharacterized protein n=1 Tax=Physcomitrium patens TaxID=3218 RepID=A0A2K1J0F9_PHYPA|nr:hypothetical protein PHYPA_022913 [Physcomitrium patens]